MSDPGTSVAVDVLLNGVRVPLELDGRALTEIAVALAARAERAAGESPFMSIEEARRLIRAKSRQAVDDLLSQGKLTRPKLGRRTLVSRVELLELVRQEPRRRR
jgi:hypothetical protein